MERANCAKLRTDLEKSMLTVTQMNRKSAKKRPGEN